MAMLMHGELKRQVRVHTHYGVVYGAMLLLSLHWAVVTYVNSSFLAEYVSHGVIGALYFLGSTLTIVAFLFISRALRAFGNYNVTIGLTLAEILVLIGMATANDIRIVIPLFILHHAIIPLLLFNLDVFIESFIGTEEKNTGSRRGLLLTAMSLSGAVAPLGAGWMMGDGVEPRYSLVYIAGASILVPFAYLIFSKLKKFADPEYTDIRIRVSLYRFWIAHDLRFVFMAHFLLQLFFAWMVIYTPLYLATIIGFSWSDIGIILFFGLMAYVLFEFPVGEIADRFSGEKEMMAVGFFIMAMSTAWLAYLTTPVIIPWIVTLFITRVGASLVETTTESYFFKHIDGKDADIISFFRITRPLAYVSAAFLGSMTLFFLPLSSLFIILGLGMLPGVVLALILKDTR